jgi:hypothetical protein
VERDTRVNILDYLTVEEMRRPWELPPFVDVRLHRRLVVRKGFAPKTNRRDRLNDGGLASPVYRSDATHSIQ